MECVGYPIEAEVPPELSSASTCTVAFFRMATSLDQLEGQEAVRKHTLFTTNRGRLVEVAGGQVLRSTSSPTDVTKIVVHHAFEPLQLYIVLLCGSGKAVLLAYQDFKVLEKWEGVKEVASADPTATGTPHLILTKLDDTSVVMSKAKLMSHDLGGNKERKEEAPGKREAVQALTHRFKGGVRLAEQLRTERRMKENFITEELAVLQSWLKGQLDEREKSLVPTLTEEGRKVEQRESVPSLPPSPLQVLRVYHKLVHDKWVVGVGVINRGDQVLVSQLELVVCCDEVLLCHTSQVLKSVKHSRLQGEGEAQITVEPLDPPVLRPTKKATVVAVCEVPSFEAGPFVSCSGLLTFTCKPLMIAPGQSQLPNSDCQSQQYQVSVPLPELNASELDTHLASFDLTNATNTAIVTFSTVALVAASRCSHVALTSLVSPLSTFLSRVSSRLNIVKVSGVSDFYVLHPGDCDPLHHTAFTFHIADSHNLNLNLYTKDEKQAFVLAHTLLAALPEDASMQFLSNPKDNGGPDCQPLDLHHMLLARMRETVSLVTDGLEAQLGSSKAPRMESKEGSREQDMFGKYNKEREELLARKGDVTFEGEEYSVWRKNLQDVQAEVDSLYLKFLKLNCTPD